MIGVPTVYHELRASVPRTVVANGLRPAPHPTIQEIRQALDALEAAGAKADVAAIRLEYLSNRYELVASWW